MHLYSSYTIEDTAKRAAFEVWKNVELRNHLWYQPETELYFSIDAVREQMGKFNSIFTYTQDQFVKEKGGTPEYVGKGVEKLQSLSGAKALIIGGGPSANKVDWDASQYDLLVSCNNFYLNPKVSKEHVGLIYINTLHPYPQLQDLINYVVRHKPLIVTDSVQLLLNKSRLLLQDKNLIELELRFNGRIGIVPRLIICLCLAGVESIDIVGMDSVSNKSNILYHSFLQKEVPAIGSTENYYDRWEDVVRCYERQYIMFFDYIFNELKATPKFRNLAENEDYSMLAGISKVLF